MLRLEEISKSYFMGELELKVLKNVNLLVEKGEFTAIMGPSGSGKTTLMNILGCLDRATSGKYFLDDQPVEELGDDELSHIRNKKIGFVFQIFNLLPRETALKNVILPTLYSGELDFDPIERAGELLEKVGLKHRINHHPLQLSGGEQQRVSIARALINDPHLILADEPTGNLDTKVGAEIMKVFNKLNEEGKTIVLITHDLGIARQTKRIVYFKDGVVEKEEKP